MKEISYICLYNNKEQLDGLLLPSMRMLGESGRLYNLILINSKVESYKSAAEGYNKALDVNWNYLGEIVCFVHQDIRFDNTEFHDRLCKELYNNPYQIIGAAGINDKNQVLSNLEYWYTKQKIVNNSVYSKVEVESLDECCFATSKELLSKVRFDEKCCFHWHLYAVDICYDARRLYNARSYVIPELAYHKYNNGLGLTTDSFFLLTMWRLAKKYRRDYSVIYSTCCSTKTDFLSVILTILKYWSAPFVYKLINVLYGKR